MAKPMLRGIPAFDASIGYGTANDVTILYNGSAASHKIYVYEAESNRIVINGTSKTGLYLTIPAGTLSNNKQYYIGVTVTDTSGTVSEMSDYVFFSCYATPTFRFSNVTNGQSITNPAFTARLQYSQAQGRGLMSYIFYLYEISESDDNLETSTLVYTSNTFYDSTLECTYRGLESKKYYYIQAVGNTVDNMVIDTGKIRIKADFVQPSDEYYILKVENNPICGWISYRTNIHIVEGEYLDFLAGDNPPDDFEFLTDPDPNDILDYAQKIPVPSEDKGVSNSYIDCTSGILSYRSGWNCPGDFLVRINFKDLVSNEDEAIIKMFSDDGDKVSIFFIGYEDEDETFYRFKLVAENDVTSYILYSDPIRNPEMPLSGSFTFNRKNNLYAIGAFNYISVESKYASDLISGDIVGL